MKALSLDNPFEIQIKERDVPDIREGEVLVRVLAVAICGTDIHAFHGEQAIFNYPRVIGHEISGVVEKAPENSGLSAGDKVCIIPYINCGRCISCRKNKPGSCESLRVAGVHFDGGMCEYFAMPAENVIKVPQSMDPLKAALIEPMSISAHAVRLAGVISGETVLVLGAGPIGLGISEIVRTLGGNIVVADLSEERRTFAKQRFGYENILNPANPRYRERLSEITDGNMPDIIFDATGNSSSMSGCFDYLGYGGKVVFVGTVKDDIRFSHKTFYMKQTELYASRAATKDDFMFVIDCIDKGIINPKDYLSDVIRFDENIMESYVALMNKGPGMVKGIVNFMRNGDQP